MTFYRWVVYEINEPRSFYKKYSCGFLKVLAMKKGRTAYIEGIQKENAYDIIPIPVSLYLKSLKNDGKFIYKRERNLFRK